MNPIRVLKPIQGHRIEIALNAGEAMTMLLDIERPAIPIQGFEWIVEEPRSIRIVSHNGSYQDNQWSQPTWVHVTGVHEGPHWKPRWEAATGQPRVRPAKYITWCEWRAEIAGKYVWVVKGFKTW